MGRLVATKGGGKCNSSHSAFTQALEPVDLLIVAPPERIEPHTNVGDLEDAAGVVESVCVNGNPVIVMDTRIPQTTGAPPNAVKGVTSPPPANNEAVFCSSSTSVFAGGSPLIRHRDLTLQNAGNTVGFVKLKNAFSLDGSGIELDPNLSPEEKAKIVENLESMYERPRTRELLDTIGAAYRERVASGGKPNPITITNKDKYGNDAKPGFPKESGFNNGPSKVAFAPGDSSPSGYDGKKLPSDVALAHELTHAYHTTSGTMGDTSYEMASEETRTMGVGGDANEYFSEARYAEERGLDVRLRHDDQTDKFPFNPKKENIAPEGFAKGPGGSGFVYCNK
jgi:hypothetical protein